MFYKYLHYIQAKNVVKKIKYSHVKLVAFKSTQKEKYDQMSHDQISLKLPLNTRFSYIVILLESLETNKEALQEMVLKKDLNIAKNIRNKVLDEEAFWQRIQTVLKILRPIAKGIAQLKRDSATLSDAVATFYNLNEVIDHFTEKNDEVISLIDWQTIKKAINNRKHA